MSDGTTIEWTDATWNPVTGCSVASPGCTNCYAMRVAGTRLRYHPSRKGLTRSTKAGPVWTGEVRFNAPWLDQPLRWKEPRRIFVCAHGDLFHEDVPDEWIDKVFAVMALAPRHTFQVLTKRAERMRTYLTNRAWSIEHWERAARAIGWTLKFQDIGLVIFPLPHAWLGVSAEDQKRADERVPLLLQTPAAVRWVSAEPLLGSIDFNAMAQSYENLNALSGLRENQFHAVVTRRSATKIDWVVAGGESGPGARPMHPDWARSIRDQCKAAGVPFFFKQWGEWRLDVDFVKENGLPDERYIKASDAQYLGRPGGPLVVKVGRKRAGALLDGAVHREFPA